MGAGSIAPPGRWDGGGESSGDSGSDEAGDGADTVPELLTRPASHSAPAIGRLPELPDRVRAAGPRERKASAAAEVRALSVKRESVMDRVRNLEIQ